MEMLAVQRFLWHYKAPSVLLADLSQPEFFDLAIDMLAPGDMVMLSARDGGKIAFVADTRNSVVLAALA